MKQTEAESLEIYGGPVIRHTKLKELEPLINTRYVYIFTASPGQGKSEFARQMAEHFYSDHIWYSITDEDKDPVHFCRNLYLLIKKTFPKFSSPGFELSGEIGELDPLLYDQYIREIIRSLKKHTKKRTLIVLDNMHLLPTIGLSYKTAKAAMSLASSGLHFTVCTRRSETSQLQSDKTDSFTHYVENSFFTFTQQEYKTLCVTHLDSIEDFTGLEKIYTMTEGWIYGILTIFRFLKTYGRIPAAPELKPYLDQYFTSVGSEDDRKTANTLMLLSLLDHINLSFAVSYQGNSKIAERLVNMLDTSHFIYRAGSSMRMHRMYAEWLSHSCYESLRKLDIELFLNQAADFELSSGNLLKAFSYLIKAGTYSKLEQTVRDNIDFFIDPKDSYKVYEILSRIPITIFRNSLWMPLAYTMVTGCLYPEKTGGMYKSLIRNFQRQKNLTGILLCAGGLLFYHYFIDGDLTSGTHYAEELRTAVQGFEGTVSPGKKMVVYTAMATSCIYSGRKCDAKELLEMSQSIAEDLQAESYKKTISFLFAFYYEKKSADKLASKYLNRMITNKDTRETSFRLLFTAMGLYMYFMFRGFGKALESLSTKIRQHSRLYLDMTPVFSIMLDVADTDHALASGDLSTAKKHIETYSSYEIERLPAYLSSQLYAYKGFAGALEFREDAGENAERALTLSAESETDDYHRCSFYFYAGAVYTITGNFREAEKRLYQSIDASLEAGNDLICSAAYSYLSFLSNNTGSFEKAAEYAETALRFMKKTELHSFPMAIPEVMTNLFRYAGMEHSVSDYAEKIAYSYFDTAFSSEGHAIPVLKINAFGEMKLMIGENTLSSEALSGNFKIMIALILSSKDYSTHQEIIQSYIWPSSNKEHARKSFDNLMSRFRKLLSDSFPGINPKDYLTINNGIVKLTNVKCNADEFLSMCSEAWANYERGEYADSLCNIFEAKDMYSDKYFPFITGVDNVDARRQYTDQAFIDLLNLIYRINSYMPDMIPLERYFAKWLDICIHENDMVRVAYSYYKNRGNTVKCFGILKSYREHLISDGFSSEEINELIFSIKSSN